MCRIRVCHRHQLPPESVVAELVSTANRFYADCTVLFHAAQREDIGHDEGGSVTRLTVTSKDGTEIAYEMCGQGPALIAVGGTTCDRALMRPTAEAFGRYFATIDYDRRGRGDSGDTAPCAVEREIEDVAALIGKLAVRLTSTDTPRALDWCSTAWLPVCLCRSSSSTIRLLARRRVVSRRCAGLRRQNILETCSVRTSRRKRLEMFLSGTGLPDDMIDEMRDTQDGLGMIALAPTLAYDSAVIEATSRRWSQPGDLAARATQPARSLSRLVGPPFVMEVSRRLA